VHGQKHPKAALGKLKTYARQVLAHPPELTGLLQTSLASEINLYRCLGNNIDQVGREIAQQLAKTSGAMLTTVRGIGITLAAGVSADLKEDHRRRGANKQHADFGMTRRFLRMGMRLMRNGESYVPPELRAGATLEELQGYYLQLWPKLLDKWIKAAAVHVAFDSENPLGQWRDRIEAIYEIELPLSQKK